MSSIEPPTTAKVVLHTTKGPIEIELWAQQAPLACRNFIQLCASRYYENCVFHRIIKNYIVQSGDPSGTGYGGVPIYDEGSFKDEFNSRLKFNRRGLVGCANMGKPDSNGSQFIITLSPTPELNGKNTLFGRVVGDTIFNVLHIGESEVGKEDDERPLYPTVITKTEIIIPYFKDLKSLESHENNIQKSKTSVEASKVDKLKRKKPLVKVSSYDDEDEEEDESDFRKRLKMKPAKGLKDITVGGSEEKVKLLEDRSKDRSKDNSKDNSKDTHMSKTFSRQDRKKSQEKTTKSDREKKTLELLAKFQTKLSSFSELNKKSNLNDKPTTYPKDYNSDDYDSDSGDLTVRDDNDNDFLTHRFEYSKPLQEEDSLTTIDSKNT